jgi:hypothetical protein
VADGSYVCATCGERHDGPSLSWSVGGPYPDRPRRKRLIRGSEVGTEEQLWVSFAGGKRLFLRGQLLLPVVDGPHEFAYVVWVEISRSQMRRARKLWDHPGREAEVPWPVLLATRIPGYPDTDGLRASLHHRAPGRRPTVHLDDEDHLDHPLVVEQRDGISMGRVAEIGRQLDDLRS